MTQVPYTKDVVYVADASNDTDFKTNITVKHLVTPIIGDRYLVNFVLPTIANVSTRTNGVQIYRPTSAVIGANDAITITTGLVTSQQTASPFVGHFSLTSGNAIRMITVTGAALSASLVINGLCALFSK